MSFIEKHKLLILSFLLLLIGGLIFVNIKLSQEELGGRQVTQGQISFHTSRGLTIQCPFLRKTDCLNGWIREYTPEESGLFFRVKSGTEFFSPMEGEVSYVRAGFGEELDKAVWYPSLEIQNRSGQKVRLIFSGEVVKNLRWVKEGEKLGTVSFPIKEDGGTYNLSLWVEEGGKRVKLFKSQ